MKRFLLFFPLLLLALTPSCEAPPSSPWASQFPVLREPPAAPKNLHVTLHNDSQTQEIEDIASRVKVRVHLDLQQQTKPTAIFQRLHARGVEDFLAFDHRPQKEEARYIIDVSERAAGLRMIDKRTLEVLDEKGTPRLRVDPPYAIDAKGTKIDATLAIENCAYDTNPSAPWDRAITPPGPNSASCALVVSWSSTNANYPLLVDPNWVETASGSARDDHTSVKLANGKVLITYGAADQFLAPGAELYDPITKTIASTGAPGDRATRRPAILLPNNKALVLGASNHRVYDPVTGTFSDTNPAVGTSGHGGGTLTRLPSGKILVAGGGTEVDLYDATTNTFSPGPAMNVARSFHAAALLKNGKVLLAGGGTDTAEIYDPAATAIGSFTRTAGNMTVARTDHEAVTLPSGKVFIVGGQKNAELFDPATGTFTATGSMVDSRTRVRATLMPSGNVFVTGGFVLNTSSALVERYEPALGLFTTAPVLNHSRGFHIAELLDNGSVMVHGGRTAPTNFGATLRDVEELSVLAAGTSCAHADDCASGICDLGTCCLATCTDTCKSCTPGTGACDVVKSADDLSSCTGNNTCDATGACKKKNGQACGAAGECASSFCIDGVCCNVACNGQCEACDGVQKGKCEPVVGAPKGNRSQCATDSSNCGGACDGIKTAACNFPATDTACGVSKCTNAVRTPNSCNGEGICKELAPRPCPGNFACLDDKKCRDRCDNEKDCAVGYVCENGACTLAGKCDGDHRVISTDLKSVTDCTPYVCDETNRCRTTCENVGHCTAPFACNRYGQCVDPASTIATGSGCAFFSTTPAAASPVWTKTGAILLALLVLSIRRRSKDHVVGRRRAKPQIEA